MLSEASSATLHRKQELSCFGPPGFVKKEAGNLAWREDNMHSPSSLARASHLLKLQRLWADIAFSHMSQPSTSSGLRIFFFDTAFSQRPF